MGFCNEYTDIGDIAVVTNFASLPVAPIRYTGKYAYIQTEDRLVYWNGTAWVDPSGTSAVVATQAALPTGGSRYLGRQAYIVADQRLVIWNGTGWVILSEPVQAYTPTVGATTTAPNFGTTASRTGWYKRDDGYVDFSMSIDISGAGISSGSGDWVFNMPPVGVSARICGTGWIYHTGGFTLAVVESYSPTAARLVYNGGVINNSVITINSGSALAFAGRYRMATRHSF